LVRFQAGQTPMLVDATTPVLDFYDTFAEIWSVEDQGTHLLVELRQPAPAPGKPYGVTFLRVDPLPHGRGAVFGSLDENGDILRHVAKQFMAKNPTLTPGTFPLFGHTDTYGLVVDQTHVRFDSLKELTDRLPRVAKALKALRPDGLVYVFGCQAGAGD